MSYSVGSLFAGIGGICLGFNNAGASHRWANEINKAACATYDKNFKSHTCHCKDIEDIKNPLKDLGYVDIITSGFPCQAFSIAGLRKGFNDPRGNMFFETARFINDIKPKAYLLENVKNLRSHDNGNTFKHIVEVLNDLNYSVIPFVLNSMKHGNIPQNRERIFVVGFKNEYKHDSNKFCTKSFNINNLLKEAPLSTNITDLIEPEKQDDNLYFSDDHKYYPKLVESMTSKSKIYQWRRHYVRENKSGVCPTLTANMGTGGHNVPLIKDNYGYRKLTHRECLRFQGFPDHFDFPEEISSAQKYKQIGNSVVVPVVEKIAKEIIRVLDIKKQIEIGKVKATDIKINNHELYREMSNEELRFL